MTRASDSITISRVSDEIWLEFVQPGVRLRYELNLEEIEDLARLSQQMAGDLKLHLENQSRAGAENSLLS